MNKKIQKVVALSLASMTLLSGCGAKTIPTLENGDQAVVTFNENAKISVTDFYNQMKDKYGTEVILNMIDKMILEKKYADSTEEAHKNADSVMSQLETSYGDKLLSAIQTYTGYQTLDEYKDYKIKLLKIMLKIILVKKISKNIIMMKLNLILKFLIF